MTSLESTTPAAAIENALSNLPPHIIDAIELIDPPEREYLTSRGVDLAVAANYGVRTVGNDKQPWDPEHYGVEGWKRLPCPLLAFPYPFTRQLHGRCAHRFRLQTTTKVIDHTDDAEPDEIKTYPKFIATAGIGAMPYIVGSRDLLDDITTPAFIVEGPAKALSWVSALRKRGIVIGLGGVEAGGHDASLRRDTGLLRPHPMLQQLVSWEGRKVYVVMDAGRVNNPAVARGEARTAQLLRQLGANVLLIQIPLHEGQDQGPDDWLARKEPTPRGPYKPDVELARKRREHIEALVETAVPADPVERAELVRSKDEARALLSDLPYQGSLAVNEDAVSGLVLRALRQFGIDRAAIKDAIKKFRAAVRHKAKRDEPKWKGGLTRSSRGQVLGSVANVMDVLRNDERLVGVFGFDEFAFRPMLTSTPPWRRFQHGKTVLTDAVVVRLAEWLEREHQIRISSTSLNSIVDAHCRDIGYHPVQHYLGRLVWDGSERIAGRSGSGWLTAYFGVEDSPYVRLVGRLWLVSAVARAMRPGCKVDTMLILEGKQGKKKSTGLRVLFGDDWFSDSLSDLGTKDSFQELLGKWCIEMSELDALNRAEATRAKQFISKQADYFRDSYGRRAEDHLRQAIFAGTINAAEYLKDWSGGRRYWPVWVNQVDIPALRRDRDQLWAEAHKLFDDGERWWIDTEEEEALCGEEQEHRRIPLRYEDEVAETLHGLDAVTVKHIVSKLDVAPGDQRSFESTVGKILQRLDWTKGRQQIDGIRVRFYVRPPNGHQDPGPTDEQIKAALDAQAAPTPIPEGLFESV